MILNIIKKIYFLLFGDLILLPKQKLALYLPLRNEFNDDYAENYFKFRNQERKQSMDALSQMFSLKDKSFCSIGCGFAGEEFHIVDKVKVLNLIEPHLETIKFVKKKYKKFKNVVYFHDLMEYVEFDYKLDVIYTSGPSN